MKGSLYKNGDDVWRLLISPTTEAERAVFKEMLDKGALKIQYHDVTQILGDKLNGMIEIYSSTEPKT